jgi:hypothetical protein
VSDTFARIIDKALAFERERRYADAATMRADIRAALETMARGPSSSLQVIPFSTRMLRGSTADVGADATGEMPAVTSSAREAEFFHDEDEHGAPPAVRRAARNATLPWVLALVLLAVMAWKLGPAVQDELVRRASIEPVRKLWADVTASATEPAPPPPPPVETVTATEPAAAHAATAAEPAAESDDGPLAFDDAAPDAGETASEEPVHDAGTRAAVPAPRPMAPHAAKPPAKRPPAKKRRR